MSMVSWVIITFTKGLRIYAYSRIPNSLPVKNVHILHILIYFYRLMRIVRSPWFQLSIQPIFYYIFAARMVF